MTQFHIHHGPYYARITAWTAEEAVRIYRNRHPRPVPGNPEIQVRPGRHVDIEEAYRMGYNPADAA